MSNFIVPKDIQDVLKDHGITLEDEQGLSTTLESLDVDSLDLISILCDLDLPWDNLDLYKTLGDLN